MAKRRSSALSDNVVAALPKPVRGHAMGGPNSEGSIMRAALALVPLGGNNVAIDCPILDAGVLRRGSGHTHGSVPTPPERFGARRGQPFGHRSFGAQPFRRRTTILRHRLFSGGTPEHPKYLRQVLRYFRREAIACFCTVACLGTDDVPTASSWIWYPEAVATEGVRQTRYLRCSLTLDSPAEYARVRVRSDDRHTFRINGLPAASPVASGVDGQAYDLANALVPGENVLAFSVYNAAGVGGLIVRGLVREAGGVEHVIHSDTTFRAARETADGWDKPGFDDRAWPKAIIVGSAFSAPWYRHAAFDIAPFLDDGDLQRWEAWRAPLLRLPDGLASEPPSRATFETIIGNCALVVNGHARPPFIYRGTVDPMSSHGRRQIGLFRDAGVHVYTAYLPLEPMWPSPDRVDFTVLDEVIRGYLSADNDARIVLILRLVPPRWWMDAHPDELVRYAAGDDFNTSDESGRVRRASLASRLWRRDMLALWRAAIEHLEEQPWGKRVIGYQPGYGIYTEWHYFGSWQQQGPDTGHAMTVHFRDWLRKRYGSTVALCRAWSDPTVSLETAAVPGMPPRLAAGPLGLRDPAVSRRVMDYYRCQQEITAEDIEVFCAAAKEATGGRVLCGAFYGYFYGVHPQTQGGHLELERLLRSPAIDYFAAPYDYSHRLMGDDGRGRALADAFRSAGKVHVIEADTRTHLHTRNEHGRVANARQSVAAIRREFATALIHGNALWWCDFGPNTAGGWYDHPELIGEVARLMKLAWSRLRQTTERAAEVALVCDLRSCYSLADGEAMRTHLRLVDDVTGELYRTGTPFETLLLSQVTEERLRNCRVLIMLNALNMDTDMRARIARVAMGRSVVWLWAPGVTDGAAFGPQFVSATTGFSVALDGGGLPVAVVECVEDHPLTARLQPAETAELRPRQRLAIAAAADPARWYNPRDAKTMRKQYVSFEWTAKNGELQWDFATSSAWTDIHLNAAVEHCDGIAVDVSGTEAADGVALRLVVKGAQGCEFTAPSVAVGQSRRTYVLPFAGFSKAPWDRTDATTITFPLRGLKLVLNGTGGQRPGRLVVHDLSAVKGDVVRRAVRIYGSQRIASPVLAITDPEAVVLGRDQVSGKAVLACKGQPGRRRVLSTVPYVPRELLSALIDESGACRYVDSANVIVRADARLVSLHTATGGDVELRLPAGRRVCDAFTGKTLGRGVCIPLHLEPDSTMLLRLYD